MSTKKTQEEREENIKAESLRARAEERLKSFHSDIDDMSKTDVCKLLHELQVYQVELELQNEELRKSHVALEESRTKYVNLYDFAPLGYLTLNEAGVITEANLTAMTMLGVERSRLINRPFITFVIEEERAGFYKHFRKQFKDKSDDRYEIRIKGKATEYYVQIDSILFRDERGNTTCRVSMTNITDRKLTEKALTKLREAQHIASLGSWNWDIVHNEFECSEDIYQIFGVEPAEFKPTYETFLEFTHPEERESVQQALNDALYKKASYSISHRIILPDKSERIVHEEGTVFLDNNGSPIQMIGTVQDITEIERAHAKTEEEIKYRLYIEDSLLLLSRIYASTEAPDFLRTLIFLKEIFKMNSSWIFLFQCDDSCVEKIYTIDKKIRH